MGLKRFLALLLFVGVVGSCGKTDDAVDLAASATPAGTAAATAEPQASVEVTDGPSSSAPEVTASPVSVKPTANPTEKPYQVQSSNGCTVSAGKPPYADTGDAVRVPITGSCQHMKSPDTGEVLIEVDGKNHGESNEAITFDMNGYFSAKPFVTQDGKVCGHDVTITVSGKYDFNANLSDVGRTTIKLTCT